MEIRIYRIKVYLLMICIKEFWKSYKINCHYLIEEDKNEPMGTRERIFTMICHKLIFKSCECVIYPRIFLKKIFSVKVPEELHEKQYLKGETILYWQDQSLSLIVLFYSWINEKWSTWLSASKQESLKGPRYLSITLLTHV